MSLPANLFEFARLALDADSVQAKRKLVAELVSQWRKGKLEYENSPVPAEQMLLTCGQPEKPRLVATAALPSRRLHTQEGLAAFVHSIAHIEFSAINLALDAVYRYRGLPKAFYDDWLQVAEEESRHFGMLSDRLAELGWHYGDFDAHNGLWEMAVKTADRFVYRMAVVPRGLEARGLDVTPGIMQRLRSLGDEKTVQVLEVILEEEIGHVAIGDRWFRYACEHEGLEPEQAYRDIISEFAPYNLKGPFNVDARVSAGFRPGELELLEQAWESLVADSKTGTGNGNPEK